MHATLNRVSLVTEIDIPYRRPDRRYFEDPAYCDVELSRANLHEATHYWQQLSSPGLLLLASEDWERLLRFERGWSCWVVERHVLEQRLRPEQQLRSPARTAPIGAACRLGRSRGPWIDHEEVRRDGNGSFCG